MIIDAITFNNELDVLEIRLRELWDVADWFVIVEANKTQCLIEKPFYFEENLPRFQKYISKIAHVKVVDYPPSQFTWAMENFQRNKVWEGIKRIPKVSREDFVMISDCDEIPNPYQVLRGVEQLQSNESLVSLAFPLNNCAFKLNLEVVGNPWIGPVITKVGKLEYNEPQDFRDYKDKMEQVTPYTDKGWHFSYMGGKEKVYQKFLSCIEPFDKNVIPPYQEFEKEYDRKIKDGGSFLFSDKKDDSVLLRKLDHNLLPESVRDSQDFNHLLV